MSVYDDISVDCLNWMLIKSLRNLRNYTDRLRDLKSKVDWLSYIQAEEQNDTVTINYYSKINHSIWRLEMQISVNRKVVDDCRCHLADRMVQ